MTRELDVYLFQDLTGVLRQNDDGLMSFKYAESWLADEAARPLSHSLPLKKDRFSRKECAGFFGGILPEESQREAIARNLGISARNDFAMLQEIGGECAGAVTFIPHGAKLPKDNSEYRYISEGELLEILKMLPKRPLLAGETGIRISLAGTQDKLAVRVQGNILSIPLGSAPSTHILKPAIARFPGIVFNEKLCMDLAAAIGLPCAPAEVRRAGDIDFLLIERYDRLNLRGLASSYQRLHQEDFCQALGIVSEKKYQREGGPSLKQCFELLRTAATIPARDLQNLLDAVIFNFLIGNCDAHGKNFSLLYDDETRLAPCYDLLCTLYYPEVSKNMAMKLGDHYNIEQVKRRNFEQLADETGMAKALVKKRVSELAGLIMKKLPEVTGENPVSKSVARLIHERCEKMQIK